MVQNGDGYGDDSRADTDHRDAILGLTAVTKLTRNGKNDILKETGEQSLLVQWP